MRQSCPCGTPHGRCCDDYKNYSTGFCRSCAHSRACHHIRVMARGRRKAVKPAPKVPK